MHPVALSALDTLLTACEREWFRSRTQAASLAFTESRFPAYVRLQTARDVDTVNSDLLVAERQGCISLEWDRRAGKDGHITRMKTADGAAVARLVGRRAAWEAVGESERVLAAFKGRPVVEQVLSRWAQGRSVRGRGPEHCLAFADALTVLDYCGSLAADAGDCAVRRVSSALFRDTKRIERDLLGLLDVLTAESLDAASREDVEVLGNLGLVRFPHALLLAGRGMATLRSDEQVSIVRPYTGIAPESLTRFEGAADYVLTVENLTTFHEIARGAAGALTGLVLYTGGMPSRAMRKAYAIILAGLPRAGVFHWGDTDLGGLRIAQVLARVTAQNGRELHLWMMGRRDAVGGEISADGLTSLQAAKIQEIAAKHGWERHFVGLDQAPEAIEQESQSLRSLSELSAEQG